MPVRAYYSESVKKFLSDGTDHILGVLTTQHNHDLEEQQRWAWVQEISILKRCLSVEQDGHLLLEAHIPRMGKRADAVILSRCIVFVVEFKVGATEHLVSALDQVEDYALDLKNFHAGSHLAPVVPVLVSTNAENDLEPPSLQFAPDLLSLPLATNADRLGETLHKFCVHSLID